MKKVLIPTKLDRVAVEILTEHGRFEAIQNPDCGLEILAGEHPDAVGLIVRSEKVTADILDKFTALKVVVRAGAGYDNIDVKHARKRGVDVMNTPGANANAVAEEVIALILADYRHVVPADNSMRQGRWEKKALMGRELAGKTVGIVGLGNIGRLVARRLRGFEGRILGYDPLVSSERARECGVELVELNRLFSESDCITLHVPETRETRKLVDARLLQRMKPGATLVNCARAGIVDEEALREVKQTRKLRFLNDVYARDEPGVKSVTDIADILMPHLGASTLEANHNAARRAATQLIDLLEKGVTSFIVNRDIPEGLDEAYCELAFALARITGSLIGKTTSLTMLETSFYGQLEPFSKWLTVPILAGIWEDFDRSNDYENAMRYLKENGVEYVNRSPDPEKGFDNSITIDLISGLGSGGRMQRTSVRGTLAENVLMVSRINEFDRLYFQPVGSLLFFVYQDRPGVIAIISSELAAAGLNIEDMRNPHDTETNRSLAILRINKPAGEKLVADIREKIDAALAMCVSL